MLYLMSCRDDSHEIFSFPIDFFNDVTGVNSFTDKAWDVQSKGTKGTSAKAIGREMVTLFKNYIDGNDKIKIITFNYTHFLEKYLEDKGTKYEIDYVPQ